MLWEIKSKKKITFTIGRNYLRNKMIINKINIYFLIFYIPTSKKYNVRNRGIFSLIINLSGAMFLTDTQLRKYFLLNRRKNITFTTLTSMISDLPSPGSLECCQKRFYWVFFPIKGYICWTVPVRYNAVDNFCRLFSPKFWHFIISYFLNNK